MHQVLGDPHAPATISHHSTRICGSIRHAAAVCYELYEAGRRPITARFRIQAGQVELG